ncbi:MAG: GyrI-like domain-containing protein [Cyclobacteriaceae bacterium]|nr:GyrI-like domain-containing protein [Cyclobacteriaceae bacterium HetDA_MAG_MS6]
MKTMVISKLDLAKADKNYYASTKKPEIRDFDPYYYLTVSGQSAPEDQKFLTAIETMYTLAYTIKFISKANDLDFTVPKLEGFWWIEGGAKNQKEFEQAPRDSWCWKIMIRMPDFVEDITYFRAMESAKSKKPELAAKLEEVKFELINEGRCAQILHLGSYEEEKSTLEVLHKFIADQGLKIAGYHHEIYLSDPRKTAQEKLKTILRYAVN